MLKGDILLMITSGVYLASLGYIYWERLYYQLQLNFFIIFQNFLTAIEKNIQTFAFQVFG